MKYDVFFSISQTPVDGHTPSEAQMYANFFDQVVAADALGFGTAWVAESHLSTETQKKNPNPVVPHWQGEVGLNADIVQLAPQIFARTKRIEVGSAVMNLLVNGGPIAAAERVATFATLHGQMPGEKRRLHVGFSAGRFDYMNRAFAITPRNTIEAACWPVMRGKTFQEASEIFCRLLRGEELASDQVRAHTLTRGDFRSDEDWDKAQQAAKDEGLTGAALEEIALEPRFPFEAVKVIPQDWPRDLVQLVIGSHEPRVQALVNEYLPVQVFNLSITKPEVIDATHERMRAQYHADGGPWQRDYMPRTTFVFLNEQDGLSDDEKRAKANEEAQAALGAYWTALEGTIDPAKVKNAANNALIGNAGDVADQMVERFHRDDRLMLWFDFFNHDSARVVANMRAFMERVAPLVDERLAAHG